MSVQHGWMRCVPRLQQAISWGPHWTACPACDSCMPCQTKKHCRVQQVSTRAWLAQQTVNLRKCLQHRWGSSIQATCHLVEKLTP